MGQVEFDTSRSRSNGTRGSMRRSSVSRDAVLPHRVDGGRGSRTPYTRVAESGYPSQKADRRVQVPPTSSAAHVIGFTASASFALLGPRTRRSRLFKNAIRSGPRHASRNRRVSAHGRHELLTLCCRSLFSGT
jgi:hypothetical protein